MRAIWSGSLAFGLVNIPVKLYSASEERELNFALLHKKDSSQIRYARICKAEGIEVPWEEIIKGYEIQKGDYVILVDEDFKRANLRKTKSIDIEDFVLESEISSEYFDKPYFLEPEKGADKAYALLREALRRSKKIGIAKFVLRNRERLCAIKTSEKVIVLNQMRFNEELRKPEGLKLPDAKITEKREMEIALSLIKQLSDSFDPEKYKDTYTRELKTVISEKAKGRTPTPRGKEPIPTKVPDLMQILRRSLAAEQHSRKTRPRVRERVKV